MRYKWLILIIITQGLILNTVQAKMDLSLSGGGRSYPYGGTLDVDMGKSLMLWGVEPKKGSLNPWYGYSRASIRVSTAGTYNAGQAKLEVFPVSILGLGIGGEIIENNKAYSAFDCETYSCLGKFSNSFGEASLALGYKSLFLLSKYKISQLSSEKEDILTFIEPNLGLPALSKGDKYYYLRNIIGFKISNKWTVAYLNQYAEMHEIKGFSKTNTLNVLYKLDKWSFALGAGVFESNLKEKGFTGNLFVKREIFPSLSLF